MPADPRLIVRQYERDLDDQQQFRQTWQDLAEFLTPYKAHITTEHGPGQRKTSRLFDSAPIVAASTLSANIQGAVANQAQDWYSLRIRNDELNTQKNVRAWCEHVTKVSLSALSASNYYTELSEVFVDLPVFAVGGLYCDENPPTGPNQFGGLHFAGLVIGKYVIAEDAMGRVVKVTREFHLPARVVAETWKDTCSQGVKDAAKPEAEPEKRIRLVHAVYPRSEGKRGGPAKDKPYASCYVEHQSHTLLAEGGYDENPYAVARWSKDSQSPYGWGPGSIAYPDVRTLNRLVELKLGYLGKVVDPPLLVKHDAVLGSLSLEPAFMNTVMDDEPARAVVPLQSGGKFLEVEQTRETLNRRISEVFYGPLLRQITKDLTATEAWMIQDEVLRLLGPAAGRLQTELLGATIERSISILFRAGQFAPPPDELLEAGFNADLDIVYEGPLARAQRSRDLVAIERKNAWVLSVLPFRPEVADKFDWDAEAALVAQVTGYPSDLIRDEAQVEQIRAQRGQVHAAQTQLGVLAGAAEAIGKAGPGVKALAEAGQPAQPAGAAA